MSNKTTFKQLSEGAVLAVFAVSGMNIRKIHRNGNATADCVFCETKKTFLANTRLGLYHCFACDENGDVVTFTMKHFDLDYEAADRKISEMCGVPARVRGE